MSNYNTDPIFLNLKNKNTVAIAWSPLSYRIERSVNQNGPWQSLGISNNKYYEDVGLLQGNYFYRIVTVSNGQDVAFSSVKNINVQGDSSSSSSSSQISSSSSSISNINVQLPISPNPTRKVSVATEAELKNAARSGNCQISIDSDIDLTSNVTFASNVIFKGNNKTIRILGNSGSYPYSCFTPLNKSVEKVSFIEIRFATIDPTPERKGGCVGIHAGSSSDISILNCIAVDLDTLVQCEGKPNRVLVDGCQTTGPDSLRGYLVWVDGSNITIRNCYVHNCTVEHCIRGVGNNILIERNNLTNLDRRPQHPVDIAKSSIWIMEGNSIYIQDNILNANLQVGRLMVPPFDRQRYVNDCIVRRNRCTGKIHLPVGPTNLIIEDTLVDTKGQHALFVNGYDDFWKQNVTVTVRRCKFLTDWKDKVVIGQGSQVDLSQIDGFNEAVIPQQGAFNVK